MIADLKPYAEYKDSGLPWIGQVPGHWEVKRLKNWVSINKQTLLEDTPGDFTFDYLDIGSVTTGRLAKPPEHLKFANSPSRARRLLQPGDTIVSTVRTYLKAVVTVGPSTRPLVASTGFAVLSPRASTAPHCLGYIAQSQSFTDRLSAESVGIAYPAISETRLGNIAVPLPPPAEQAAIVRFLDWANGRLERAIRAKRKVIALLNEQKQAIIHRAVTRGLDPSVPLKPSGIPWLGEIPAHWEVRRLKWVLRLQRGFDLPADRRKSGNVPVYSSGGHIDYHDVALATSPGVVIGRYGSTDAVFFVTEPYWPHNTALFTTTFYNNHARWCFYLLRSIAKGAYAGKSAVPGVDRKDLFDIVVPRPPVREQRVIVEAIDEQLAAFNRSSETIAKEIDLLREYRTRLVADVVTGKLDVREAAARLPEEEPLPDFPAGEEEPLEEDLVEDDGQ